MVSVIGFVVSDAENLYGGILGSVCPYSSTIRLNSASTVTSAPIAGSVPGSSRTVPSASAPLPVILVFTSKVMELLLVASLLLFVR